MEKWKWRHNLPTWLHCQFFWLCHVSLVKFSYGGSFMSISLLVLELRHFLFIRGLTRNPKIGNSPIWVLSIIWRLGWVRDTKFGMNVSNEKLLNAANYQDCGFYRFLEITGKLKWGKITPTQIMVNSNIKFLYFQ